MDIDRLKKITGDIASGKIDLEFSLDFTVSDKDALQKDMLVDATRNARQKAEILCAASGTKLGDLLEIHFSWGELNIISHTDYEADFTCMPAPQANAPGPDFTPEDINIKDTATFVWAIE